ncbi:hypothetical protein YC2023_117034 [Brassica napus]
MGLESFSLGKRNKYHIILTQNAVLTKIQSMTEFNFLCCANYETILRGLSHPKFCIGMGQNFSDNFVEISCVSNGTVAEKLYENWFSSTAKVVVCVLKLWRIEWREGATIEYINNRISNKSGNAAEERREGNQKHQNFYIPDLQDEYDPVYSKPQNKRLSRLWLEISFGFVRHFQQAWI